jgi:hypothetical protein
MSLIQIRSIPDALLVVGAPLLLAIVELFHPHPGDLLQLDLRPWMTVHYAQIVLFPLAALALATLVRGDSSALAAACRVASFVFAVTYVAFDTAAGVITGILVQGAHASATPDSWRVPIETVWAHPIVGGSPDLAAPFLAVVGTVAWSVGAIAAAIRLKQLGSSWGPLLLLVVSSFGIAAFKTHASPGGPITFGGLALAAFWLWLERSRRELAARRLGT